MKDASGRCQQNISEVEFPHIVVRRCRLSAFLTLLYSFSFSNLLYSKMAPGTAFQTSPVGTRNWTQSLIILAVVLAGVSVLYSFLDSHLDWFYILSPPELHDLSLRAIAAHGNDTRSVVTYITSELQEKLPGGYINLDQEWIFNNAGGAMGAMYIIHASKLRSRALVFNLLHARAIFGTRNQLTRD